MRTASPGTMGARDSDHDGAARLIGNSLLANLHLLEVAPTPVGDMHRTSQTGIERMHSAQNFHGAFGVRYGRLEQRGLVRATLPFCITRTCVPRGRDDALIILDGPVFDLDP